MSKNDNKRRVSKTNIPDMIEDIDFNEAHTRPKQGQMNSRGLNARY